MEEALWREGLRVLLRRIEKEVKPAVTVGAAEMWKRREGPFGCSC
jgi:hypothetical protein